MSSLTEASSVGPSREPPLERWLFILLLALLIMPSLFFVVRSYSQVGDVLATINTPLTLQTEALLDSSREMTSSERASLVLEHDVITHRHQRATAFIATRTWMRFMSLMFGSLLVMIGCAFVLGRVSSPDYQAEASASSLKASLKSSSPGLFLIAAGIILVAIPNLSAQRIETDDTASYFVSTFSSSQTGGAGTPRLSQAKLDEIKKNAGLEVLP